MSSLPATATSASTAHASPLGFAEHDVRADEIGLLYRNASVSQSIVLIAAPALAASLWTSTRPGWVLGWLVAMVAVTVVRLRAAVAFRHLRPAAEYAARWGRGFIVGACLSGALWGSAGLLLAPEADLGTQFMVIFTLAGMVAAAAPTLAPLPIAFHLFAALALAPLALRFVSEPDGTHVTLGMLTILYLAGMATITQRIHRTLRTSLELRQQNRALVEVLTRANADAEDVNAKLRLEVAEHRLTERDLEKSLSLLKATLESTNDGIMVVGRDGRILGYNQRFLDLWRLPASAMAAGTVAGVMAAMRPRLADPDGFTRCTQELAAENAEGHDLIALSDGRTIERYSMPQRMGGEAVGRVCSYRDVTERKRAEEDLQFIANHDALTQLPNRALFARCLADALARARRRGSRLSVLFIDLDRFKNINDTLGHDAGDRLLCEMARRLRASLRETDTVARLGGDEFVVLAEDASGMLPAVQVAQRILDTVTRPHVLDGRECHVTASIGIATYPDDGLDASALLKHADIAMYRAKDKGKNAFELYAEQLNEHTVERLALEASLRHAVERDELVLHYQPKIELASGRVVGVEALLRWRHPELGFVPPNAFIPLAEETGLIVPIGAWVLHAACEQAKRWCDAGLSGLRVAVNISARQFARDDLAESVDSALAATGLDPDLLELELTESMTMTNVDRALAAMAALKQRGIHLAIDDFGTGYSSLGYLKRFPIDNVKIDRSFVKDLPDGKRDCALAQATIAMAHALGLRAVAEGVETAEQAAFLQRHGCDEVQGYHYAKPLPAAEIEAFVASHT